jgi:hypothetical protein
MRLSILTLSVLSLSTHSAIADDATPVPVGIQKQLLVDDYVVAETRNVERVLGRVEKVNDGEPIFKDGWFYGTVLHDQDRFKLWFRKFNSGGYGYAESMDGINFSKKANLTGINFAGDINLAIELNRPDAEASHRYLGGYDAPGMAAGIAYSKDGIKWRSLNDGKPVTFRAADCHNQVLWDPIAKTFRLFTRTDYGSGGGPLANTVAADFEVRGTRGMTNPDIVANPTAWRIVRQWYFDREGKNEYLRRQIYSMTVWVYEGIYFGLMSVYEYPGDVSEGRETDLLRRHERDVMNFYIATSRDCDNWDLTWVYSGKPIVPRGADRSFDKDVVFPSSTVVTHADRHWFYYGGGNERHGTAELDSAVWFEKHRAIGLATLPLDRIVGWHAGARPGTILTRPFVLEGATLLANVDAKHGAISVEVLGSDGEVIPGYGTEDSVVHSRVDDLRFRPKWKAKRDLSELVGKTVRLRFRLTLADLYAFQITR